jgi:Flp pilus assembly protein TadD
VNIKPEYGEAHYELGLALARAGRAPEADAELKLARELIAKAERTQRASDKAGQAELELKKGESHQAITYFMEATRLAPDWANAHRGLGAALSAAGDVDGGIAEFRKSLELQPNQYNACYGLGLALLKKGASEEAVKIFQRLTRLRPSSAEAFNQLGVALAKRGETRKAIDAFKRALELDSNFTVARENLEKVSKRTGNIRSPQVQYLGTQFLLAELDGT